MTFHRRRQGLYTVSTFRPQPILDARAHPCLYSGYASEWQAPGDEGPTAISDTGGSWSENVYVDGIPARALFVEVLRTPSGGEVCYVSYIQWGQFEEHEYTSQEKLA